MPFPKHGDEFHTSPSGSGGFPPVIGYAECNTSPASDGTPSTASRVPFDTFYDVDQAPGSLPAGLALTYTSDAFEATEDGVWIVNVGVEVIAAPGSVGNLQLRVPNLGYFPILFVAASGNNTNWVTERIVVMRTGDTFYLQQFSAGSSVVMIDGYAILDIVRISDSVS